MSQRPSRKGKTSQGRGPWSDGPRQQPPLFSVSPGPEQGVYSNPHMAYALTTLIGCVVDVKTVQGVVYEGVLTAISPNMDVVLSTAHDKSKVPTRENVLKGMELQRNEVVTISAKTDTDSLTSGSDNIFKTDTEISRNNGPSLDREFEPYTDFNDTNIKTLENNEGQGWSVEEMFIVNKEKFKVTSNFNEDMPEYTTELKRDGEAYRMRAERAKVLASEIEGKTKHAFDDAGTEEELFSSVQRDHKAAPPPHSTLSTASQSPSHSTTTTPTPHSADVPSATKSQVTDIQPTSSTDHSTANIITNKSSSQNVADTSPALPASETAVTTTGSTTVESGSDEGVQVSSTTTDTTSSQDNIVVDKPTEKKLNPAAKEFRLNPNAREFKPPIGEVGSFSPATGSSGSPSSASPSHVVTTTSSPSSSYYNSSGGRRSNKPRQPRNPAATGGVLFPMAGSSEYLIPTPAGAGGFVVPQALGGMVRPGQLVSPGGQVLYQAPYQIPGQPMVNAYAPHIQQVVSAGGAQNAQQQIMLAPVQQQMLSQQHPALYPAVGLQGAAPQGQPYQQMLYTPQAAPGGVVYNMAAQLPGATTGATPGALASASLQSPQPLITAPLNPSQASVFAPGQRLGYQPHPPGK